MGHGKQVLDDLRAPTRSLRHTIPDQWGAFATMHRATFAEGALPLVTKELLAVALGVAQQCDGCIASHTRAAVLAGATREQFAEMLSVALFMMGGPGSIYGPKAWEMYEEFAAPREGQPAGG